SNGRSSRSIAVGPGSRRFSRSDTIWDGCCKIARAFARESAASFAVRTPTRWRRLRKRPACSSSTSPRNASGLPSRSGIRISCPATDPPRAPPGRRRAARPARGSRARRRRARYARRGAHAPSTMRRPPREDLRRTPARGRRPWPRARDPRRPGSRVLALRRGSYLASRFCAATAMTLLRAAVAWHVFALTGSAYQLGLIGVVQFLPALGLMLFAGAVADAHDRP